MIHALVLALAVMSPDYDLSSTASGISCSGDDCTLPSDNLAFDCNTCPCLIYQAAADSDVAACGLSVKAGNAYPLAAVNTAGADSCLMGGQGANNVEIISYGDCGTDTVTVTINGVDNVLTEGAEWAAATSDADTCTSLCSAIDALVGVSCDACSTATAPIAVAEGCTDVTVAASDPVCATANSGDDGDTYTSSFVRMGKNQGIILDGRTYDTVLQVQTETGGSATVSVANVQGSNRLSTGSTGTVGFGSRGIMQSPYDGGISLGVYPITPTVTIDARTDDVFGIKDSAGTAGAAVELLEQTAPSAGASNTARLYAKDNGSGKTQLCVLFATGAEQCFATEP